MASVQPAAPVRREPPWWVVVLAIPLVGMSLVLATVGIIGGVSALDAISATRDARHSMELPAGGGVSISATSSGMVIEAGPEGQVSVEDSMLVRSPTPALARAALDTFRQSTLTSAGGGVAVSIPTPANFNLTAFSLERRVTVRVPAGAALTVRGDSVAADVRDLRGPIDVSIGSGAVRFLRVTVAGDDRVTTTTGAIDFKGSLESGSLDLETTSGAISLELPAGTNATYDAATSRGAIFIRPESGQSSSTAGNNRSLAGDLGDGGGVALRLRATSGAISILVG